MDGTVIRDIADQLGMAADQAGQFIQEYLPQYASMKVALGISNIALALFFVAMFSIALAVAWRMRCTRVRELKELGESWLFTDSYDCAIVVIVVLLGIAAIAFVFTLLANVPDIVAWSTFPEAKLIDLALKAVG